MKKSWQNICRFFAQRGIHLKCARGCVKPKSGNTLARSAFARSASRACITKLTLGRRSDRWREGPSTRPNEVVAAQQVNFVVGCSCPMHIAAPAGGNANASSSAKAATWTKAVALGTMAVPLWRRPRQNLFAPKSLWERSPGHKALPLQTSFARSGRARMADNVEFT